jgi:hypothetical protein
MKAKPKQRIKCGRETHVAGKYRICERQAGHYGRHMTYYCGRRKYWHNDQAKRLATPDSRQPEKL